MKDRSLSRGQLFATVAAVSAILLLTLIPSGSGPRPTFSYDLDVDRRWLADGILNLCLFVPLGLAVGWNSGSRWRPAVCGLILSTAIEMAQTIVPGRDPALSDICFNTLGTVFGALLARRPYALLSPEPSRSAFLALIAGATIVGAMCATVFLLSPYGSAVAKRSGNDLLLQYPTRAGAIGLDEPEYWLQDAFQPQGDARIAVSRERNHWRVRTGREGAAVGPTVGQGWTLLGYPNAIARRWGAVLNGLWLLLLFVPIGLWARGRSLAAAAVLGTISLALIPVLAGVVRSTREEWAGAAIGLIAGVILRHVCRSGYCRRNRDVGRR